MQLTTEQLKVVKGIKGQLSNITPDYKNWFNTMIYICYMVFKKRITNSDTDKRLVLNLLLDIYVETHMPSTSEIKALLYAAMAPNMYRSQDNPLDRVIGELCGLIEGTQITDAQKIHRQTTAKVCLN
jgi:hypothetical protein